MGRSTVHYADNKTNNALKKLHNKLRPAGTPVQRVEYIIELLLLRIFETKIKQDDEFKPLRKLFSADFKWKNPKTGQEESNENRLFSYLGLAEKLRAESKPDVALLPDFLVKFQFFSIYTFPMLKNSGIGVPTRPV
jgi:hypothetical protein